MSGFWLPTATADPPWWLPTETADPPWWLWSGETVTVPDPPPPPPPVQRRFPTVLRYTPPHGAPELVIGRGGIAEMPLDLSGLSGSDVSVTFEGAPGQWGATATSISVPPRTMGLTVTLVSSRHDEAWEKRERLAGSMVAYPSQSATLPPLGRLRIEYADGQVRVLDAIGKVRPGSDVWLSDRIVRVELEWLASDPRWRTPGLKHVELRPPVDGGFHGPIHGPLFSVGGGGTATVNHVGTVPAPVLVRFHGPSTGASVVLDGGARVALKPSTVLGAGEEVWVNTALVSTEPKVTFRDNGTVIPAAQLVDWSATTLWQLPPGSHVLEHQFVDGDGGYAVVSWETHWAGI